MPTNPPPNSQSQSQLQPSTTTTTNPPNNPSSLLSPRSRRQFALYALSSTLLTLSILSTRRALLRRYASTTPAYFQPSFPEPLIPLNLRREATEALRLATINVLGFAAVAGSGGLWAADINSLEELKAALAGLKRQRKVKGGRNAESDEAAEKEFEDFVGPSLERRSEGDEGGR